MKIKEFYQIIKNGENSHVEFKNANISTNDLAYEIAAFANFEGGILLIGVDDDGKISGVERDNFEEYLMNICRNNINPGIIPSYERLHT
ncbi:MAG: helix-turn-helix domain-containing protein, partial [bacterium]